MIVTDLHTPTFNSYASVADLRQCAAQRHRTLPETAGECEPLLVEAMDYLNGLTWNGTRQQPKQPLPWPRVGVSFDGHILPEDEIPQQIILAQCLLALEAMDGPLLAAIREAEVKSVSVAGAVTTTYAIPEGKVFTPSYPAVMAMLRGLLAARTFATHTTARRR